MSHEDWAVFSGWRFEADAAGTVPDWANVATMVESYGEVVGAYQAEIDAKLEDWDRELKDFRGDPTKRDWRAFRPLRLAREEDWADWLAFLIETSTTGVFSHWLFRGEATSQATYASPKTVEREVEHGGYRSDLMIEWSDKSYTHLEIKVGDQQLAKTYETGKRMRAKYGAPAEKWSNFILLLSKQLNDWEQLEITESAEPATAPLTWQRVSVALRRGLQSGEDLLWKACAYMFVGSIEQLLIGYGYSQKSGWSDNVGVKLQILEEGWSGE